MIFGGAIPWPPARQRQLLRACFHVDTGKAFDLSNRWFDRFNLNDVTYPEHRLLVRLLARFPELEIEPTAASRIAGLQRQLWVRGNMNLKAAKPALDTFDDFGILWVLSGAAQWFVQLGSIAHETADIVEIIVPEQARSTALHLLVQNGWRSEYTVPDAAAGPVFTRLSKGSGAIRLGKASPLFTYAPDQLEQLWDNRITQDHDIGRFFLPDVAASVAMAFGRTHPKYGQDDQWVFDLFSQDSDPKSLL
ncbi:MAG: hypothetical protein L3J33_12040 [Rhodobacteraceae bacterium]|nr:hypothetical protein [Paracoccaceae bacterium]